jgi:nucleotide-binding universal stress UspA family protein
MSLKYRPAMSGRPICGGPARDRGEVEDARATVTGWPPHDPRFRGATRGRLAVCNWQEACVPRWSTRKPCGVHGTTSESSSPRGLPSDGTSDGTSDAIARLMFTPAVSPIILLAAIDFSESAPLVARRARESARQMNAAQLHFVHVHPTSMDGGASTRDCEHFGRWLGAQMAGDTLPRTQVLAHESSGDPARAIIDLGAKLHAACIIVGARSRTSGAAGRIGSVARAVIGASDCPVLVVRPDSQLLRGSQASFPAFAR